MSVLRDNKVLIHNVYKRIKQRGTAYIGVGGKSNSVRMVVRSKHNRIGTQYALNGLAVSLNFNNAIIKESGDIVSIGVEFNDRDTCNIEMLRGYGYNLNELVLNRLFTVDVASNQQLYKEANFVFDSSFIFNQKYGIKSDTELKDFIGSSIDTKLWRKISSSHRISSREVDTLLGTIIGSPYYKELTKDASEVVKSLQEFFFEEVLNLKGSLGFNKKANFINFVPIVSFDFSKNGRVKFYSRSGYVIDSLLSELDMNELYNAIVIDKMFNSKIEKKEFNYNQYTIIVGK